MVFKEKKETENKKKERRKHHGIYNYWNLFSFRKDMYVRVRISHGVQLQDTNTFFKYIFQFHGLVPVS